MHVRRSRIGISSGTAGQPARPVEGFELDTGHGLAIEVWTYGATLVEVRVPDRSGRIGNVVLRHRDLSGYENRRGNPYLGATVGRYCRNVANARFFLDGVEHELDRNDNRHHIHGGTDGFDRLVWDAEVRESDDQLALHLHLTSPAGDQGYPGTLTAESIYRVSSGNRLVVEHRATTDSSTIVGLTNHAYWNLGGGTINGHQVALNATRMLAFDGDLLPIAGPPVNVEGTPFDFTVPRVLGLQSIDNFLVLDDPTWAAELANPETGRWMRVVTDQPGLGVYSADRYRTRPRGGICLEAGAWPDAPNRPDFPSARLDPGAVYISRSTHEFGLDLEGSRR